MTADNNAEQLQQIRNDLRDFQLEINEVRAHIKKANLKTEFNGKSLALIPGDFKVRAEQLRQRVKSVNVAQKDFDIVSSLLALESDIVSIDKDVKNAIKQLETRVKAYETQIADLTDSVNLLRKELAAIDKNNQVERHNLNLKLEKVVDILNKKQKNLDILTGKYTGYKMSQESQNVVSFIEASPEYILEHGKNLDAALYIAFRNKIKEIYEAKVKELEKKVDAAVNDVEFTKNLAKAVKKAEKTLNEEGKYTVNIGGIKGELDEKSFKELQKMVTKGEIKRAKTREAKLKKNLKSIFYADVESMLYTVLETTVSPSTLNMLGLGEYEKSFENKKYVFQGYDVNGIKNIPSARVSKLFMNFIENIDIARNTSSAGILDTETFMKVSRDEEEYEYNKNYKYRGGYRLGESYNIQKPGNQKRGYNDLLYGVDMSPMGRNLRGALEGTCIKLFNIAMGYLFSEHPSFIGRMKKIAFRLYYANVQKLGLRNKIVYAERNGHVLVDAGVILGVLMGTLNQLLRSGALPPDIQKALLIEGMGKNGKFRPKGAQSVEWVIEQFVKDIGVIRTWHYEYSTPDGYDVFSNSNGVRYFVKPPKKLLSDGENGPKDISSLLSESYLPKVTAPNSNVEISDKQLRAQFSAIYLMHKGLFVRKSTPDDVAKMVTYIDMYGVALDENMVKFLDSDKVMSLNNTQLTVSERNALEDLLIEGRAHTKASLTNKFGSAASNAKLDKLRATTKNTAAVETALNRLKENKEDVKTGGGSGGGNGGGGGTKEPRKLGDACCCCQQRAQKVIPVLEKILSTTHHISNIVSAKNTKANESGGLWNLVDPNLPLSENVKEKIREAELARKSQAHTSSDSTSKPRAGSTNVSKPKAGGRHASSQLGSVLVKDKGSSKSQSQLKQEAKDAKRQEQKSFIELLIPELSKLFKKNPIWDAIKLLLFKFGATHPKTAAALLLGGAPLALGAGRFLGRTLLGIPNWAAGRGRLTRAIAGAYPNPAENFKNWAGAVKSNTFSGQGVASVFKNTYKDFFKDATEYSRLRGITNAKKAKATRILDLVESVSNKPTRSFHDIFENIWENQRVVLGDGFGGAVHNVTRNARRVRARDLAKGIQTFEKTQRPALISKYSKYGDAAFDAWTLAEHQQNIAGGKMLRKYNPFKLLKDGVVGNAKFNWNKYSMNGKLGTWKTLGKAAKGAPGIGALFEVLFDIPDIIKAATSGKKGALIQQLSQTLGGAIGAIVGAFLGPLGWILGPLIGRSIGKGFGARSESLGRALGNLMEAINSFAVAFKPITDTVCGWLESFGSALADGLVQIIDAIASFVRWMSFFNKDAREADEKMGGPQKRFLEALDDPNSKEYKNKKQEYLNQILFGKTWGDGKTTAQEALDANTKTRLAFAKAYEEKFGVNFFDPERGSKLGYKKKDYKATRSVGGANLYMTKSEGEFFDSWLQEEIKRRIELDKNHARSKMGAIKSGSILTDSEAKDLKGIERHTRNGVANVVYMGDLGLHGTIQSGNSIPYIPDKYVGRVRMLDNQLAKWGIKAEYSSNMGGHDPGTGHYMGRKVDVVTKDKYGRVVQLTPEQEQWLRDNRFMNGVTAKGYHNAGSGYHYDLAYDLGDAALPVGASGVSGEMATETVREFAQTSDDIVPALMALARETNAKNKQETVDKIVWDPTDVTGSIACWGIVQLNSSGKIQGG